MGVACVRFSVPGSLALVSHPFRKLPSFFGPVSRRNAMGSPFSTRSIGGNATLISAISHNSPAGSMNVPFPLSGVEEVLMGFISGNIKATELAHSVWTNVIQKGDTVVDATCGNGYDTLALLKMVADESRRGSVYGLDIQKSALENTSALLGDSVSPKERELVKLFPLCHSKMEQVIPKDALVRLVAFNLGYLPGGDKGITTMSQTTLLALQAAKRILDYRGIISVVVYVGHPGGREELETVQAFASGLSVESWVSCKFEMLNRPNAPILILFSKK